MTWIQIGAAAGAVAIVVAPLAYQHWKSSNRSVSYQSAMMALASVRARLNSTGGISDEAGKAIEAITHALVSGSDL